jgi:hypothetical protein
MDTPTTLGTIIAWIESNDDTQALRFEPTVYQRIHADLFADKIIANIRRIHQCTYETAAVIYSTSYGKYQIMGNALYDPSFLNMPITFFDFVNKLSAQDTAFTRFVESHKIDFTPQQLLNVNNAQTFAIHYNGSPSYANNIKASLAHFGVK